MFTGLVQDIGIVKEVIKRDSRDARYVIETNLNLDDIQMGASICCSGCCLTVVKKFDNAFAVEVSSETLSKTHLGAWRVKSQINLEPSLRVGDELGGHFVSGHVDAVTKIIDMTPVDGSCRVDIEIPLGFHKFIAAKGSVALDGVSLTVNEVNTESFSVNVIPHTRENTTFGHYSVGDKLNLEIDMLARYVANMLENKD